MKSNKLQPCDRKKKATWEEMTAKERQEIRRYGNLNLGLIEGKTGPASVSAEGNFGAKEGESPDDRIQQPMEESEKLGLKPGKTNLRQQRTAARNFKEAPSPREQNCTKLSAST